MNLHFQDINPGGKNVIVFLHGFPFDHSMWEEQARLCASDFRVITYDHRGHGKSEAGNGQYIFEMFIDDLFGLLDKLHVEKAILCGLSMGGYLALRAIERNPERVQGLVLCDTRSEADSTEAKLKRAADLRLIQEQGLQPFAEKFLKNVFSPTTYAKHPDVVNRIRRTIVSNPQNGVPGTLIALATRTDTTPSLDRIRVPTLILVGADDVITPVAAASAMHERVAGSQMAVIPEAGHLSNLENPTAFNKHLLTWLMRFHF